MIIKRKFVWLCLLTTLIMTLVFVNLNVASIGATGTGNPGTTMTFNSNITMDFGSDKYAWLTNGSIIQFKNITTTASITAIRPGLQFTAKVDPGLGYGAPLPGHWYYLYAPAYLYGMYIAIQVDAVWGTPGTPSFNVSQTWDMYYDVPKNFTIFPPVAAGTYVEAEHMIDPLTVCYDYFVLSGTPTDNSWWEIDYPGEWASSRFHIDDAFLVAGIFLYAHIDTILNATGANVPSIPADPIPNEGFGAFELITTVKPSVEYYIFSPAPLLPEPGSWWNITYPAELSDIQFKVGSSSEGNYFVIDTLWNTTAGAPVGSITLPEPDYSVSAVLATAPTVNTIGTCDWFNVVTGVSPDSRSWWNITTTAPLNATLVGVQFYVDAAGEGIFHIDEVLSGDINGLDLTNVTAEELIPAIYVEPASIINTGLTPGTSFTVSIKTNYTMNIWSYEFTLTYNPLVLNVTGVTNGDLITGPDATFYTGGVDYAAGKVKLTGAKFVDHTIQTPGPGTLANVTFTVVGTGDSDITLGPETRLVKVTKGGYGVEQNIVDDITGLIEHSYFRNYEVVVTHDVAVTNVVLSVNKAYQTWTIQVNVTVLNNGTISETFDVKVYYDQIAPNWLIETQTVSNLGAGANTNLTINCALTDVSLGNRTIIVKATLAFGVDANPTNNVFVDSKVLVKLTGDIDADGDVDPDDFYLFAGAYGTSAGDPTYKLQCDLDGDGDIDPDDFYTFSGKYGTETTNYP